MNQAVVELLDSDESKSPGDNLNGAIKVTTRSQRLKMFMYKDDAKDEVRPVKTAMSGSSFESRTHVPGQLPRGDLNATYATPRTHPPAYTKMPRNNSPVLLHKRRKRVRSSTQANEAALLHNRKKRVRSSTQSNEAALFLNRKKTVRSSTDKEAVHGCSRTDTVYGFTFKETNKFRITREHSPVPNSRTDPVLSSTDNAAADSCSRTETVLSLTSNEADNVHITREHSPASRADNKAFSSDATEADFRRRRTDISVSSSTAKEAEKFTASREMSPAFTMRTMASNTALARRKANVAKDKVEHDPQIQMKEDSDHNFRHEGPSGTSLTIILIIKEGGCINSSAPPVDDDVEIIAARSIAGKHTVSISATRCQAYEPRCCSLQFGHDPVTDFSLFQFYKD